VQPQPTSSGVITSIALFSDEDDSDDSTQQEEENEDDESDENESETETPITDRAGASTTSNNNTAGNTTITGSVMDEFALGSDDQVFERRGLLSSGTSGRTATPGSMQWAIRSRDSNTSRPGANGLVFIDHASSLRRSTVPSVGSTPQQATMSFTSSSLARAFNIILR
jgi:hypothetical protein